MRPRISAASLSRHPSRSCLYRAVACALLLGFGTASAAAQESGVVGDPGSWVTDEFKRDWGLGAIGAQYAYARGLSGNGISLGITDTGTFADHPEFAGSGRLDGISVEVKFNDGSSLVADGGIGMLIFGDHGTHTAGTIAASRDGSGMHGVAFGTHLFAASTDALGATDTLLPDVLASLNDSLTEQKLPQMTAEELRALLPERWGSNGNSDVIGFGFNDLVERGIRAISNSWGTGAKLGGTFDDVAKLYRQNKKDDQPIHDAALRAVRDHDVLFVFAAGNESGTKEDGNEGVLTHAGVEATLPAFLPEFEDNWVSVMAVDQDLQRSDFSSICGETRDWCIAAPGRAINSTTFDPYDSPNRLIEIAIALGAAKQENTSGDSVEEILENYRLTIAGDAEQQQYYIQAGIDITRPNAFATALDDILDTDHQPRYADYEGTSMATPHVTGALGLLMERFPYLDNTQVRDVMLTTATDLGEAGVDEIYGWGLVNLEKAIEGPGMLRYDTVVDMDQAAGGAKVWEGDAWDDWTNDIGGPGSLFKDGVGWLRLSGNNSFAGASVRGGTLEFDGDNALTDDVEVVRGNLILNGNLRGSELQVYENGSAIIDGMVSGGGTWVGGWLGGSGTLGDATIAGTIAPGDGFDPGIGTLTFDGDYAQAAGSVYAVDLSPSGDSDRIDVSGSATLEGGTVAAAYASSERVRADQSFRILSAADGVSGAYDGIDWDKPFLATLELTYSPFAVDLDMAPGIAFASVAGTWNQLSTAMALDGLADANPLLPPMLQLNEAQALAAFDQLSGELYPSLRSVLIDSSRMPREAALDRARAGADGFARQAHDGRANGAWAQVYASGGHLDGDGNAARVDQDSHALLAGYDYQFDAGWRIGGFIGDGRTNFSVAERGSKGHADTRHFGVYGGGAWGGFGLRAGWIHASHDIDTERHIAFPGFSDRVDANFDGRTRQAVIEAGYRFDRGRWEAEPFLQYADVRMRHDRIDERGGAAALTGDSADSKVGIATAGARFHLNLAGSRQGQTWLSLRGMLGYRKTSGDRTPETTLAFAEGPVFAVRGAPLTDHATVAELGFAARTSHSTLLEVGYSGQFTDEGRDHGADLRFSWQF